jgi:CheY-like chemotaxis protein|tara:strand:- start:5675 stop:6040 length:366 start_codon:yes stop_codon:yes gene_type:complete
MAIPLLICDDSNMAQRQIRKNLPENWQVDISYASDGKEALEYIRAGKGEVVFLDLTMPVMNGYEVLAQLQKENHKCVVFVVSADVQPQAIDRVKEMGAAEFFGKPIDKEILLERLRVHGLI